MIMYVSSERTNRKGRNEERGMEREGGARLSRTRGSELEEEGERNEMASIPLCVSYVSGGADGVDGSTYTQVGWIM